MSSSTISSCLVKADRFFDLVPVASSATNLIDLFLKCAVVPCLSEASINKSRYWTHLKQKSFLVCLAAIFLPVLANIGLAIKYCKDGKRASLTQRKAEQIKLPPNVGQVHANHPRKPRSKPSAAPSSIPVPTRSPKQGSPQINLRDVAHHPGIPSKLPLILEASSEEEASTPTPRSMPSSRSLKPSAFQAPAALAPSLHGIRTPPALAVPPAAASPLAGTADAAPISPAPAPEAAVEESVPSPFLAEPRRTPPLSPRTPPVPSPAPQTPEPLETPAPRLQPVPAPSLDFSSAVPAPQAPGPLIDSAARTDAAAGGIMPPPISIPPREPQTDEDETDGLQTVDLRETPHSARSQPRDPRWGQDQGEIPLRADAPEAVDLPAGAPAEEPAAQGGGIGQYVTAGNVATAIGLGLFAVPASGVFGALAGTAAVTRVALQAANAALQR